MIDKYYDTSFFAPSKKEMVLALAKNKEVTVATTFLESNKAFLIQKDLYREAQDAINQIISKLSKE